MLDVGRWAFDVRLLPSLARGATLLAAVDADESVRRGGNILGRGWAGRTHPFYDPQTDDVRLIPPQTPPPTTTSSPNFSFDPRTMGWIVFTILAIIFVLTLIFFLRRMRSADASTGVAVGEDLRRLSDVDRIEALPFRVSVGQGDLLSQATELYRQGRFAEAIVLLFSYFLVEMDKRQVIRLTKGKTNRQYLREIGRRRSLRNLVERTMVAFEAVFFGHHPLDREGFEACWSQVAEFQRLVENENP